MKKISSLFYLLLFFLPFAKAQDSACNSCTCFSNSSAVWNVEVDDKGNEYLISGDSLKTIRYNTKKLIAALNNNYLVKIKLVKVQGKTLYIKITNSTLFTQSLGDAGADWYLAALVFTLTENPANKKVYINFEEGDHGGQPGSRSRKDFEQQYKICR